MKVKLRDLKPNPHRNFAYNPLNPDRVKEHEKSIKEHGMWQVLRIRKVERANRQEFQLVFGHHRVEALKNLHGDDYEIEVEIVDYDDSKMLLALSAENDPAWNHSIIEIDEMVAGAKSELEKMKEDHSGKFREFALSLFSETSEDKKRHRVSIGAPLISLYLRWPVTRVEESLTRLTAIEEKILDRAALYSLPTAQSAMTFLRLMKQEKIDVKDQPRITQKIISEGRLGKRSIERTIYYFQKWRQTHASPPTTEERGDIEYCERTLDEIIKSIQNTIYWMEEFQKGMHPNVVFPQEVTIDDIKPETIENYEKVVEDFLKTKSEFNKNLLELKNYVEPAKDEDEPMKNILKTEIELLEAQETEKKNK